MIRDKLNSLFSIVVLVNDEDIYKNNILSSPLFKNNNIFEIIPKYNYPSASIAYNEGIDSAKTDLIVFAHQDVIFPGDWDKYLFDAINKLEEFDQDWGVLGCFGVKDDGEGVGFLYCNGNGKILGKLFQKPTEIQTLDEVVLVVKKSSGIRFDEKLPNFHFYGTDICLIAKDIGKKSYAIPAFILHNSNKHNKFPKEFFVCHSYIVNKWKKYVPIYTTCVRISGRNSMFTIKNKYIRNLKFMFRKKYCEKWQYNKRNSNPLILLEAILNKQSLKVY